MGGKRSAASQGDRGRIDSYLFGGDDHWVVPHPSAKIQRAVGRPVNVVKYVSVDPILDLARLLERIEAHGAERVYDCQANLLTTSN